MPRKDKEEDRRYGKEYYRKLKKRAMDNLFSQNIAILVLVMALAMSALSLWVSLSTRAQYNTMFGP